MMQKNIMYSNKNEIFPNLSAHADNFIENLFIMEIKDFLDVDLNDYRIAEINKENIEKENNQRKLYDELKKKYE